MLYLPRAQVGSNLHSNCQPWIPSEHWKWDTALQGETFITARVYHNRPYMHEESVRSYWEHLSAPYVWFILWHFCQHWLQNCTQNIRFGVRSQHGKWDDVLQWEMSITDGIFPKPYNMLIEDGRSFWQHWSAQHGSHCAFSAKTTL